MKAVFFDFWGTLVENGTYSPLRQTYKALHARMPFSTFAEQFENVYMVREYEDQVHAFTEVCKHFSIEPKQQLLDLLIGIWNKNKLLAKLYPDTIDTLKNLKKKGLKIAIISNAPQNNVESLLERFEMLQYVDGVFISYKEGKLKTNGLFELALKKLKLKKTDVISVGDSLETDVKGAEAAGIKAILIDRKGSREHTNKISNLTELTTREDI